MSHPMTKQLTVVLASLLGAAAHAEEAPRGNLQGSYWGISTGIEGAAAPSTFNGTAERMPAAVVATLGIRSQGMTDPADRHLLVEWDGKLKLKLGSGSPGDQRTAGALGFGAGAAADLGYLARGGRCSPYLWAGAGLGAELIAMSLGGGVDAPNLSVPQGQGALFGRLGAGVVCWSGGYAVVASPMVALRKDLQATGPELGFRGRLVVSDALVVLLEAAHLLAPASAGWKEVGEDRLAIGFQHWLGRGFWIGLDAGLERYLIKNRPPAGVDVSYDKEQRMFSLSLDVGRGF